MARRWLVRVGPSILLAHALAIFGLSHVHYSGWCPKAQAWGWYELGIALAAWPFCLLFVNGLLRPTYSAVPPDHRRRFLRVALGLGLGIAAWWAGVIENNHWLFPSDAQVILGIALALSRWLVVTAAVAGLLSVTVRVAGLSNPASGGRKPPDAAANKKSHAESVDVTSGIQIVADLGSIRGLTPPARQVVAFALFLIALNAFVVWFVQQENIVYYWDYMLYWTKTGELAEAMKTESPLAVLDSLRRATQSDDYGPLPAVPPAFVVAAFGESRLVYVLAVANIYLVAFAAVAVLFVRRMIPDAPVLATVVPLATVLLCPVAWVPILRGYLDVGGAAVAVLVLFAYFRRPAGELGWSRAIQLAFLLVALTLFRRWYSFFVVAFFLAAGADTGLAAVRGYFQSGFREAVRRAAPLGLAGLWAFSLLFALATGWVIRAATTNYADDYYAYKHAGTLAERAWQIVDGCGPGYFAAAAVGLVVSLFFRETRRPALVIAGMVPIMAVHFLRTQDPGPHHCYLFLPALVLLPSLAAVRVLSLAPSYLRWPVLLLPITAGVAAMYVQFSPVGIADHDRLRPAVSRYHYLPLTRPDGAELVRLLKTTDAATPADGIVVVASSSIALNPTMLLTADRSLGEPIIDRRKLRMTPEVDRVSGFPEGFFHADVVVVVDPPGWHLRPEEQQVVIITAESLLKNQDIGKAFDRLPGEYRLWDPQQMKDATAYIFRRARAIPQADLDAYIARLNAAHPTRWRLNQPPRGMEKYLAYPFEPRTK